MKNNNFKMKDVLFGIGCQILFSVIIIACNSQDAKPVFVVDPAYRHLTQENIADEYNRLLELNFVNENNAEIMESIKMQIAGDHNKDFYIIENDISENIIIGKDDFVVTDNDFYQLVNNLENQIKEYTAQGIEVNLLDYGNKLYNNKLKYNYLKVFTPYAARYTHQYYFNFSSRSYNITINSIKDDLKIENIIKIEY